jgi:hypothetical protein
MAENDKNISIVEFPLKTTRQQDKYLNDYFYMYYRFYVKSMRHIRTVLRQIYESEEWKTNTNMVRSVMTHFPDEQKNKKEIDKSDTFKVDENYEPASLDEIIAYIKPFIIETNNEALTKKFAVANNNEYETLTDEKKESKAIKAKRQALLSLLSSMRFRFQSKYQITPGNAPKEVGINGRLESLKKDFATKHPSFNISIADILISGPISKSLQETFDKKQESGKHRGEYKRPAIKKFNDFTSLQMPALRGNDRIAPFKFDWENEKATFFVPQRLDNLRNNPDLPKYFESIIKMKRFGEYRKKLIQANQHSQGLFAIANEDIARKTKLINEKKTLEKKIDSFSETGVMKGKLTAEEAQQRIEVIEKEIVQLTNIIATKSKPSELWFFKFPTLVRKRISSGKIVYMIQITYRGVPEIRAELGTGTTGIAIGKTTVAIWSNNPNGLRETRTLNPAYFAKTATWKGETHTDSEYSDLLNVESSKIFHEANAHIMEEVVALKKDGTPKYDEPKYRFMKGKRHLQVRPYRYGSLLKKSIGARTRAARKRKQGFNWLSKQIIQNSEEIHYVNGHNYADRENISDELTDVQSEHEGNRNRLNFAPATFIETLKNKVGFVANVDSVMFNYSKTAKTNIPSELKELDTDLSTQNITFFGKTIENAPTDIYHAFLLANTQPIIENKPKIVTRNKKKVVIEEPTVIGSKLAVTPEIWDVFYDYVQSLFHQKINIK